MMQDDEGFHYPAIDETRCVDCGNCLRICPMNASEIPITQSLIYGAKVTDDSITRNSASGGICSLFIESFCELGQAV